MRTAWGLPVFRRLLAAYALNELAWSVGTVALSVLVYQRTGSALGSAGFFLCSAFLPALLGPPLVARLDQQPPKYVLTSLYALEAVLFALLAWMTIRFSLTAVLVLSVADGAVATVARALASAARAEVLKPIGLLREGNAIANGVVSACFFAGPILGGFVVALGGTAAALLANSAIFAIMAPLLATAGLPAPAAREGPRSSRLRAAVAYARADRGLLQLLGLQGLGLVFFTISMPVEIIFVSRSLHDGPAAYGALLSAWGGGAVAGSLVYARWRRGRPVILISASAAVTGVGFGLMAVAPTLGVALIGAVLGGIGNGVESVALRSTLQERTPDRWMALIMSLSEMVSTLAPGLGILLGGVITALTTARVGLGAAAAGSLLFAAYTVIAMRPEHPEEPEQPEQPKQPEPSALPLRPGADDRFLDSEIAEGRPAPPLARPQPQA
jgi:MFS family permease